MSKNGSNFVSSILYNIHSEEDTLYISGVFSHIKHGLVDSFEASGYAMYNPNSGWYKFGDITAPKGIVMSSLSRDLAEGVSESFSTATGEVNHE